MTSPSVAHTVEFRRIAELPRRVWTPEDAEKLADDLTEILRTPTGTERLFPVQAVALYEGGFYGGLFAPIGVGEGKTIVSMLMPVMWGSQRPLLLMPGGLTSVTPPGKTERERHKLSKHWRIPTNLRIYSYNLLGLVQAKEELETYQPDGLILEEAHRLKNKRAAVTRVISRYMLGRPDTKVCVLSGTMMDKSVKEFAHLALWALKWGAPVPTTNDEIGEWAEALDVSGGDYGPFAAQEREPGALLTLCTPEERETHPPNIAARHGFRRRLTETPGVVATVGEGEYIAASIYVREIRHKVSKETEANFRKLRTEMKTPDDWELMTGVDVWRHAQELALGLYYRWNPRPPPEWMEARRNWGAFVRATINHGRKYDSELHVANACDAGDLPAEALERWREIRPTFEPNVEAVWCDDSALHACHEWMKKPGIVWTEHGFFAERLATFTGHKYYGAGGFASDGQYIEDAAKGSSIIASIDANREGKNLQGLWNRMLYVCPPSSAAWMEQSIARVHRTGQEADEVIVDVLLGCRENFDAIMKAIEGAKGIRDTMGKTQKLLIADVLLPTELEIDALKTPRWQR